ncbi:hypothetical protein AB0B45_46105 [Nonomuraea sp. NPDC049152]|uniref:hypothetical protein n=1 Tax=Nonomuraea sp. NPDC049152 TaxID=3154350 RepID=UPI0033EE9A74
MTINSPAVQALPATFIADKTNVDESAARAADNEVPRNEPERPRCSFERGYPGEKIERALSAMR